MKRLRTHNFISPTEAPSSKPQISPLVLRSVLLSQPQSERSGGGRRARAGPAERAHAGTVAQASAAVAAGERGASAASERTVAASERAARPAERACAARPARPARLGRRALPPSPPSRGPAGELLTRGRRDPGARGGGPPDPSDSGSPSSRVAAAPPSSRPAADPRRSLLRQLLLRRPASTPLLPESASPRRAAPGAPRLEPASPRRPRSAADPPRRVEPAAPCPDGSYGPTTTCLRRLSSKTQNCLPTRRVPRMGIWFRSSVGG